MLVKIYGSAVNGIGATTITIEVNIARGAKFILVGLPDNAVKESKERIHVAMYNQGYRWPGYKVVVNMSPADIRKEGSAYDLPIAMGVLVGSKQLVTENILVCNNGRSIARWHYTTHKRSFTHCHTST